MAQRFIINDQAFWIESCCRCEVAFAMSDEVYRVAQQRKEQGTFYCPNGHSQHYISGERMEDILRRDRDRLKQQIAYRDDRIAELERENAAQRGAVTRIKNRIANGVCPCCKRAFSNLHHHMQTKHPDFKEETAA